MLQLLFGKECRKIMNQNHQKFHFRPNQRSRIVYLCLGSLLPSSLLSVLAVSNPLSAKQIVRSYPLAQAVQTDGTKTTQTPILDRIAQGGELSDLTGNWAEPFIRILVANGIVKGYPDGTFKPNQLVTRAEFAALVNKAFSLSPSRTAKPFKDVPPNYWAAEVIQKAYQSGFLAGYANNQFAPNQNILRIESLVSLINGSKLEPTAKLELDGVFADAAQIPSYGQNAIVAATQRCVAIGVDYDNSKLPGGNFKPNQGATRADVAAFIHQVLVSTGKLAALDKNNPINKYIASCPGGTYATIVANDPTPPPPVAEATPAPAPVVQSSIVNESNPVSNYSAPVSGLNSPSAFGANWGEVFAGVGYQNTTRPPIFSIANARGQGGQDGAIALGLGLGNSRTLAGLEVIATSNSTVRRGLFSEGAISLKLHKQFGSNFALAVGSDNAIIYGTGSDVGQSYYGVTSLVLNPSANLNLFSNTTVSLGIGDGRYRNVGDVREDRRTLGLFGSIGTRISPNISLIADWDGQDLGVGVPIGIPLGSNFSIGITPAVVDLVNSETGGRRFVFSGGVGYNF
jgi:S-layer homology domain